MIEVILGIHPGPCGALAVLDVAGAYEAVHDLPMIRGRSRVPCVDGDGLVTLIVDSMRDRRGPIIVEQPDIPSVKDATIVFEAGALLGSVAGALGILPAQWVCTSTWRPALKLGRFDSALPRARALFPTAELSQPWHEGRAKALLIAHWAANWGKVIELPRQMPPRYERRPQLQR